MEKTDPLLRISHVRKSFGTLEVLKDISIDVYKGDVVSILGPSGSGDVYKRQASIIPWHKHYWWSREGISFSL